MSGAAFAPTATFRAMRAVAAIRAECDHDGRCFKSLRYLALKAGMPLATFRYSIRVAEGLGLIRRLPHEDRRRPQAILVVAEGRP